MYVDYNAFLLKGVKVVKTTYACGRKQVTHIASRDGIWSCTTKQRDILHRSILRTFEEILFLSLVPNFNVIYYLLFSLPL